MTVMTVMTHPHRTKTSILPGSTRQQNGVPVLQVPTIKTSTPEKKKTHNVTQQSQILPLEIHRCYTVTTKGCFVSRPLPRSAWWCLPGPNPQPRPLPEARLRHPSWIPRRSPCPATPEMQVALGEKKTVVAMVVENAMGVEKPVCHW